MGWSRSRTLGIGGLALGVAAAFVAVSSGLGRSPGPVAVGEAEAADATITARTVAFPGATVVARVRPDGVACFTVSRGTSTVARSCVARLAPDQIAYARSRRAVGGLAGRDVRAVIVKLTHKGTVWATVRRGVFYAQVPKRHEVRAVVKIVRGGKRTTFAVRPSR